MLAGSGNSPDADSFRLTERALYLQRQGLIPQNINIRAYVMINRLRGISPETILIALLLRGGKELLEVSTVKTKPTPIEVNQAVTSKKDDSFLVDEVKWNLQLMKENASLRTELSDVRFEKFTLRLQNESLRNHIVSNSKMLLALSEGMDKIETQSSDAMAVKKYAHNLLPVIALSNYLACDSNKTDPYFG